MQLVTTKITKKELNTLCQQSFGVLVKAVVDIRKKVMVVLMQLLFNL